MIIEHIWQICSKCHKLVRMRRTATLVLGLDIGSTTTKAALVAVADDDVSVLH